MPNPMTNKERPLVSIVGRPNVGKSTFFNRLVKKRIAIVDEVAGTTRDRHRLPVEWERKRFWIEDTGGFTEDKDGFAPLINDKISDSLREADMVVLMLDVQDGVTPQDRKFAAQLRKEAGKKPLLLAANKADNDKIALSSVDFFSLGLGEALPISALHGKGTEAFLDSLVKRMSEENLFAASAPAPKTPAGPKSVRIAVVGRPNVGKSSLVNALIQEERMLVSETPGTTRDSIDLALERDGEQFILTDTLGLRKKKKVEGLVEHYAVSRVLKSIEISDCAALMIDAREGVAEQEQKIAGFIHDLGKAAFIVVNKWDLTGQTSVLREEYKTAIKRELHFMDYAPIVFTSALKKEGIGQILKQAKEVVANSEKVIDKDELKAIVQEMASAHTISHKGRLAKIYSFVQDGTKPPTFVLSLNKRDLFHFSFRRQLENRIREKYELYGTPIKIIVKSAKKPLKNLKK